jgi:large subunit ribosomal protein L35Ae
MKGIVVQFRRGRKTVHERHYLLDLGLSSRDEAKKFAGKEVSWTSPGGKVINGKISDAHGNKGVLRAIFERGLPGQAVTTEVEVSEGEGDGKNTKKKDSVGAAGGSGGSDRSDSSGVGKVKKEIKDKAKKEEKEIKEEIKKETKEEKKLDKEEKVLEKKIEEVVGEEVEGGV